MSKRLLLFLLIVSLSFNFAVIISIYCFGVRACPAPRDVPPRPDHVMLPPHLQNIPWNPDIRQLRSSFDSTRVELMRELAKDPIDEETVNNILQKSLELQNSLESRLGERLLTLRKQMTAEEAYNYFSNSADNMQRRIQHLRNTRNRRNNHEENKRK